MQVHKLFGNHYRILDELAIDKTSLVSACLLLRTILVSQSLVLIAMHSNCLDDPIPSPTLRQVCMASISDSQKPRFGNDRNEHKFSVAAILKATLAAFMKGKKGPVEQELAKMLLLPSISWTTVLTAWIGVLLGWELCWLVYCRTFHPLARIPGPFLASFSRLWIWRHAGQGRLEKIETELHRKHGQLVRIAPNEVSCSDPGAIKELYRNRRPLEKSDFYTTWTNTSFGKYPDNFSITNEKEHSERRRIVNHVYSLSNVLQSEPYIDDCSRLLIQKLGQFADKAELVDLGMWLQMYAFDVIGELYFGKMFGFMSTGKDYQNLIHSLDVLNPVLASVAVSATYARPFILLSAVASSSVRSALQGMNHVTKSAKDCVNQRQEALKVAHERSEPPRRDLLQQLFSIMQQNGEEFDFGIPEIQYEAYVALFAGSDTTAIAMRSVLYHLSRCPEVYSALLKEIDSAFAVTQYPLDAPIPYTDAAKLPLLCATIKEAMRLHPSVGFTMPRVSPYPEGLDLNGRRIPPGFRVGINANIVQRDRTVFGEDSEEFRPQRWLSEETDAEQLKLMDHCMLNFGAGTRTCIGKNISLSEMHKLIPQILRNFELIRTDITVPWTTHNYWFNKQTGLTFKLRRRVL